MPIPLELEVAKERILEAQAALEAYIQSEHRNSADHVQLADALRHAINDFWDTLMRLLPATWR